MPDVLPPPNTPANLPGAAPRAQVPTSGGAPPTGGNQEAAFKRILEKGSRMEAELARAREELAELRGRIIASPTPGSSEPSETPHSWAEMSDAQLSQAQKLASQEQNHAALDAIMEERINRKVREMGEGVRKDSIKEMERRQLADHMRSKIVTDFGQDAVNPDSQLYNLADRYFGQLANTYGKEAVLSQPHFQWTAFSMAHRDLHANDSAAAAESQKEIERLKRQMQLERGSIMPGVTKTPESAQALAQGNIKGAILGTKLFRSIEAETRAKYGG